jgi:hypothetical protein
VFSRVDLKFKEVFLKPYSLFRRPREKLSRGWMIQVPSICMESVNSAFEVSFVFCIPCEYFILLEDQDHSLMMRSSKGAATTYLEWIAALDLAIMWDFKEVRLTGSRRGKFTDLIFSPKIRKTCIEALSVLIKTRIVFDNILLARKYKVKRWLRDAYVQLLQQKEALEFGDDVCTSETLDLTTIVKLLYIREKKHCELQCSVYCCDCSRRADDYFFNANEAGRIIDEVFADEFAGMHDD